MAVYNFKKVHPGNPGETSYACGMLSPSMGQIVSVFGATAQEASSTVSSV